MSISSNLSAAMTAHPAAGAILAPIDTSASLRVDVSSLILPSPDSSFESRELSVLSSSPAMGGGEGGASESASLSPSSVAVNPKEVDAIKSISSKKLLEDVTALVDSLESLTVDHKELVRPFVELSQAIGLPTLMSPTGEFSERATGLFKLLEEVNDPFFTYTTLNKQKDELNLILNGLEEFQENEHVKEAFDSLGTAFFSVSQVIAETMPILAANTKHFNDGICMEEVAKKSCCAFFKEEEVKVDEGIIKEADEMTKSFNAAALTAEISVENRGLINEKYLKAALESRDPKTGLAAITISIDGEAPVALLIISKNEAQINFARESQSVKFNW
jgi:hypothetical protein